MNNYAIINGYIFKDTHSFEKGILLIKDNLIEDIRFADYLEQDLDEYEIIDAKNNYVLPGFIDIHVNGGGNHLAIDCTDEAIQSMALAHAKRGTTSILPTTISCEINNLRSTLNLISKYVGKSSGGAHVLGTHLEGPFLNPKKGGAHRKDFLYAPSPEMFESLYDASNGTLKILSLAPELCGTTEIIKLAKVKGIIVGLAHSEADYETTMNCIKHGMSLCTHLFNGMNPMTHRAPGAVGAFLTSSNVYVEIIADGHHVHPATMEISMKANSGKTILVTDAVSPAGTETKEFDILGTHLKVNGYSCFTPEGVLAGSALTLNHAVDVVNKNTSLELEAIIPMVTENPAQLLGVFDKKGTISVGKDADIIIADSDMNIQNVFIEGEIL